MAFNRNRSFNNRGGFGSSREASFAGRAGGGRSFDRPTTMHRAVCDKCRKDCEVPFRPTSGKPVYCSDCFDRPTSRRPEGRDFQRPNFEEKRMPNYEQQFTALNSKLDKILNILLPIVSEAEAEVETEEAEEAVEEIKAPKKSSKKK